MSQGLSAAVLGVTVLLATCAVSFPVASQDPPQPAPVTAALSGTVIDAATKRPMADVLIQLGSIRQRDYPEFSEKQLTDSGGRFVFADLPANSYFLRATKSGYFDGVFGATPPDAGTGRTISLNSGQWFSSATITMSRPSSITGTVTDERGEPVVGVYVRALQTVRVGGSDHLAATMSVLTDDRGVYRIGLLTPGRYVINVPSIQASAAATTPAATLAGMSPQAAEARAARGLPLPVIDPMLDIDTNTRVVIGHYPVPPPPVNGQLFTYPITFNGGGSVAQASGITLESGADITGVDVRLAPVPAVRVSGVVEAPADARPNLALRLLPEGLEELGVGAEAATALVASDGSFVFANVPAGNYVIDAPLSLNQYETGSSSPFYGTTLPRPLGATTMGTIGGPVDASPGLSFTRTTITTGAARYSGRTPVTVGPGGLTGVIVTLQPSVTVSGRLVGEPDPGQPVPSPPRSVSLETATGDPTQGLISNGYGAAPAPGEFQIGAVPPGLYFFRGSPPWSIKSIMANGRDYTHAPLDVSAGADVSDVVITFTNAVQILSGTVRASNGGPADEAAVVIFPAEPTEWVNYGLNPPRIKTVLVSTTGLFSVRGLPAGDYYVVAVPAAQSRAWRQSGFFARARGGATQVVIGWGDTKSIDLRVAEIR